MKFIIFLSLIQIAFAAPELRSAKALHTELNDSTFSAQLTSGFHFNDKAPNGIQVKGQFIRPTSFSSNSLKIEKLSGDAKTDSVAHLYVCDDKVTFCEMHTINFGKQTTKIKNNSVVKGKIDSHGFLVNDFGSAIKKAQKENKLLLVDFGARWCPACIRLENEIFTDKKFRLDTKSYVKAKIDIDVFASSILEEKYKIRGVPTVLFLTPDGQEITRFYDFQPMDFINDVLAEVKKYPESIEELEKKELNSDMKQSLAKRYFFSDQNEKAVDLMENMDPQPKEYWFARVGAAQALAKKDESEKKQLIEVLKSAIKSEPESSRSIAWRKSLAEATSDKTITEESDKLTDKLLSSEELLKKSIKTDFVGDYTGLEGFYVAILNADVFDAAKVDSKKAWEKVVAQGEKYKIDAKKPGASLRLLAAMMKVESYDKSLIVINNLLKKNPLDGDLQRRKMRVLVELKKYKEAIQIGEVALKNSYGINEFFVVEPLAKAYINSNKKEDAKKLISKYLSRNEINFSDLEGIKGKLEKLNKEL